MPSHHKRIKWHLITWEHSAWHRMTWHDTPSHHMTWQLATNHITSDHPTTNHITDATNQTCWILAAEITKINLNQVVKSLCLCCAEINKKVFNRSLFETTYFFGNPIKNNFGVNFASLTHAVCAKSPPPKKHRIVVENPTDWLNGAAC